VCIEKRLGRKLSPRDFIWLPVSVEGFSMSEMLFDRKGLAKVLAQQKARERSRRKRKAKAQNR
jgi:hypothetical protein